MEYGTNNKFETVIAETNYPSKRKSSIVFIIALITLMAVGIIVGIFIATSEDSNTDTDYLSLRFGNIITSKLLFFVSIHSVI